MDEELKVMLGWLTHRCSVGLGTAHPIPILTPIIIGHSRNPNVIEPVSG